jgi:DNA-binding response OmpR family regulator
MQNTSLAGRSILIVEDEPLIALDIATAFEKVGAVTFNARTLAEAIDMVEHDGLSAAVLDFGLGDDHSEVVCRRLTERDIPFVLHSGYTHASDACRGATVVPKPAPADRLITTIAGLLRRESPEVACQ